MSMRITVDENELKRVREQLGELEKKAPNVIARALNRSVTNIKSNASKSVREVYNVKADDIKKTLRVEMAKVSKLQASVISRGKLLGLDKFKFNPSTVDPRRKKQLKISVKKGSSKQILGAFIANKNGKKIFKRDGKSRLPISRLMGPSVPQMIGNKERVESINDQAYKTYHKNINHDINYMLKKMGAR